MKIVAAHAKLASTASAAVATLAMILTVETAYAWDGNNAAARAPRGAAISEIDTDDAFGCQHLDQARKAGPLDQLRDADLRSGECTRFARGEQVYVVHKLGNNPQTDRDGRRVSPALYAVQRVVGGPTYYMVGEVDRE